MSFLDVSRFDGSYEHVFETTTAGVTIQAPQLDVSTVAGKKKKTFWKFIFTKYFVINTIFFCSWWRIYFDISIWIVCRWTRICGSSSWTGKF